MSLLSSSRALARHAPLLPPELVIACLHTSAAASAYSSAAPSRTRLAKTLKPRGSGQLVVAPERKPERKPERDAVPHSAPGVRDMFQARKEANEKYKAWNTRRREREERYEAKAPRDGRRGDSRRSTTTGWAQSSKNFRGEKAPARDVADHGPPWRMRRDATAETDKTANYGQGRATEWSRDTEAPRKPRVHNPLSDEFDRTSRAASTLQLPAKFASPPLMEGFLTSVVDVLGPHAQPTPIQALSLKHLFKRPLPDSSAPLSEEDVEYVQCLLASETGSGKSMAYLLPMLQDLKISEMQSDPASLPPSQFALAPRALVLAPTHELSRQLSGFAKALLHEVKLRVLCVSQANNPSTPARTVSASKMSKEMDFDELVLQEGTQRKITRPVDVVVGTPSKILELVKGRSWDREQPNIEDTWDKNAPKPRAFTVGKPEMGLDRIEWVVVDEADVLFDPDFQEHTKMILSAIAEARGQAPEQLDEAALSKVGPENPAPINYPFNLLLSTATIPSALAWYLDTYHPALLRLASPHLHHLPKSLKTVYVAWSGGNRNADVERQLRYVWQEDVLRDTGDKSNGDKSSGGKSKVLIFCNRSTKVEDLGRHLEAKGIANVALTSTSEARKWGSNHHLDGFLKDKTRHVEEAPAAVSDGEASAPAAPAPAPAPTDLSKVPHVMITTSLLSRGLDFSPDLKHVFIVDEPRNMIDFLHRAGRSGRAGEQGKVIIFGKTKGRGSAKAKDMRKKVGALATRPRQAST